jgi:GDP-4-dehydro-6-deoxy-D-mannose reductase
MSGVLVTGGTGFVGRHLVPALRAQGTTVTVLASRSTVPRHEGVDFYDIDIRHTAAVRALVRDISPDFIYHLAGVSAIGTAAANPELTYEVNVLGAYNIFEAAMNQAGPVRVLNVSTSQVYAPSAGVLNEQSPVAPSGPYASSKAMAEMLAAQYRKRTSGGIITVRPFNHTGPGQSADFVLSSIARQFAEIEAGQRRPELALGNIQVRRDFTDVRDVVRAYSALMAKGRISQVYNVGSGVATSIKDAVAVFERLTGIEVAINVDPGRLRSSDVPEIRGDASKITRETGWTPQIDFETTLNDLLNFWRSECRSSKIQLDASCA